MNVNTAASTASHAWLYANVASFPGFHRWSSGDDQGGFGTPPKKPQKNSSERSSFQLHRRSDWWKCRGGQMKVWSGPSRKAQRPMSRAFQKEPGAVIDPHVNGLGTPCQISRHKGRRERTGSRLIVIRLIAATVIVRIRNSAVFWVSLGTIYCLSLVCVSSPKSCMDC